MRYGALFTWGIVMYAIMFLLWSGFTLYGFSDGAAPRFVGFLVLVSIAIYAGRSLRFSAWRDILPYSIAWTVVVILLDVIFSVPFTGWELFTDWNVWVGYALIVFIPLLAPYTVKSHAQYPRHDA